MQIYNDSWKVYYHINKVNDKIYIGITSKELQQRWGVNGRHYKTSPHFYSAIQKYGWDSFEHYLFADNLTEDEACNMQKLLIKQFETTNPQLGYNISEGGNTGCLLTGQRHPRFGKHHTEQAKMKNRLAHLGKSFNLPESAKQKISKAMIGNKNGKMTSVRCIETGQIFESAKAAGNATGCDPSAIIKCTKGVLHKTNNLHWQLTV